MSDHERPDIAAFRELETLVRHMGEDLAGFRRRALAAEARLREVESTPGGSAGLQLADRVAELDDENARLREQLEAVTARTKGMLERVRFLRQQAQGSEP
ncbi:MAG TPA: hypothetical protein VMH39_12005 [Gemmatimonadaceae bacterium]|nr:hypothetical protein [Gemmatimonadaceae bacterium]